ncbi:PAS domain-containing sensor histidine kinase [Limibaculum sp. FT325]|nr:PAS domain-containing sensor histidine kinase [Limibaculum sediminis]MCL5778745.1 PAS domain-containing sensor histidine kinase [Limibaculum sediminis]
MDALAGAFSGGERGKALSHWMRRQGAVALAALGPVLAVLTSLALGRQEAGGSSTLLRAVLLADLCYLLILAALIGVRISALVAARRRGSAGSKLHLRLTGVFAAIALIPTIIVAVFATVSINLGIETWFSERVGSVVRNSLATAEAYEREHRRNIQGDVLAMANDLNRAAVGGLTATQLQDLVIKQALLRELPEAFVFTSDREIVARGEFSYLFSFEPPTDEQLARARAGEVVVTEDEQNNEIRALVYLTNFFDAFLYVSRDVQGDVLRLLDRTRETVQFYEQLERERGSILFDFALIYLGFALLVIVAAILMGLWFAERLARPVGRLVGAAERIAAGDLDARVKEERGKDEIALLSRVFNRMAGQVQGQRDALVAANRESERRRRLIEAVLSGVTAGVLGIDGRGRIDLVNLAAAELLGLETSDLLDRPLDQAAPDFAQMMAVAREAPSGIARGEVALSVAGQPREFLCRIAPKMPGRPDEGHVLTFDDVTALASAQRMAAWGDVARRIAHEIKNPLTPIQLSADRMRRKFVGRLGEDGAQLESLLDVITRQAGDIRRMVDEFSRFARMPEPVAREEDLAALVREAVLLQREGQSGIEYSIDLPDHAVGVMADRGLLNQCLTNLLQNAADAIEGRRERDGDAAPPGRVAVCLREGERSLHVVIADNGLGLPADGRDRLTDPYVTHRKKGTGLGLAIVKKIVEQHGGELTLGDAPAASGLDGAQVVLKLPRPAGRTAAGRAAERADTATAPQD